MKKIYLSLILALSFVNSFAQIVSPYSKPKTFQANDAAEEEFGFFPFRKKPNSLQGLYDKGVLSAPNSISLSTVIRDSLNANAVYTEFLSFIPAKNHFKLALSLLLTSEEKSDSTNNPQDVALQKLINGGGNLSVAISKPIYYNEFYTTNFFIVNADLSAFFDITAVNKKIYNPGSGAQFNIDSDFRLFTEGTSAQNGNIFRLGFKLGYTKNLFSAAYYAEDDRMKDFKNVGFGTLELYLGLLFLDIRYNLILSNNVIFNDRKSLIEVAVMPIKF